MTEIAQFGSKEYVRASRKSHPVLTGKIRTEHVDRPKARLDLDDRSLRYFRGRGDACEIAGAVDDSAKAKRIFPELGR